MRSTFNIVFSAFLALVILSGCSSLHSPSSVSSNTAPQTILDRNQQLLALQQWKIKGKIAFIQGKQRESASLQWQYKNEDKSQQIHLNTYLGINILHLESQQNWHKIEVDGKVYYGDNLEQLIYSLTELTLPTSALLYWLKGLPYQAKDHIIYNEITQLPESLTSQYNGNDWTINYDKYQQINNYNLATNFTIKQNDLLIKIAIKEWILY